MIFSTIVAAALLGIVAYEITISLVEDFDRERENRWYNLSLSEEDHQPLPYPVGAMPVELDPNFQEEKMFSHPGSKRVVALKRRLRQEREALSVLSEMAQGEDGKWRLNGKFVSKMAVQSNLEAREEARATIASNNGKLRALNVR